MTAQNIISYLENKIHEIDERLYGDKPETENDYLIKKLGIQRTTYAMMLKDAVQDNI